MRMSKFTPGPWDACRFETSYRIYRDGIKGDFTENGCSVVTCIATPIVKGIGESRKLCEKTTLANARLIASAPDLYGTLEELFFDSGIMSHITMTNEGLADKIRQALKKAEGK
jgi:hypothetical protein